MTTINWNYVEVMPLAIGGAGLVLIQVDPATPYASARIFVGPRLPNSQDDNGADLLQIQIAPAENAEVGARGCFWGAVGVTGLCVQFYGLTLGGAWEAGPSFTDVDLTPNYAASFPWSADWVVQRLQEIAAHAPPFPNGKDLRVTRAFPRDTHSWPAVNVQVDAMTPTGLVIGDVLGADSHPDALSIAYKRGRLYSLALSVTGWCGTPEERSLLGEWMGGALEVVQDAASALGWPDPSSNLRESEDFETLGVPAFLVNGNLTVTLQSCLDATLRSSYRGRMLATAAGSEPLVTPVVILSALLGQAGQPGFSAYVQPTDATLTWSITNGYVLAGQGTTAITFALGEGGSICTVSATATGTSRDTATGVATMEILPQPETGVFSTTSLLFGAEATQSVDLGGIFLIDGISTSTAARIRVYGTQAQLLADAGRPMGTMVSPGSGLIAEAITADNILSIPFKPFAYGAPQGLSWVLVDNLEPNGGTTITAVTISAIRME